MHKIITLNLEENIEKRMAEIKDIFYEASSVKNFRDEEHRISFFEKWCGDYIKNCPNDFYLMLDSNTDKLLGYLSGMKDSYHALTYMRVPGQSVFQDEFVNYPAHLHINFHASTRGMGLGSILTNHYCQELRNQKIPGVHLVTSPDALNVSFYKRLGFDHLVVKNHNGSDLLFMGKNLA